MKSSNSIPDGEVLVQDRGQGQWTYFPPTGGRPPCAAYGRLQQPTLQPPSTASPIFAALEMSSGAASMSHVIASY